MFKKVVEKIDDICRVNGVLYLIAEIEADCIIVEFDIPSYEWEKKSNDIKRMYPFGTQILCNNVIKFHY